MKSQAEDIYVQVGRRLRLLRERLGWTQAKLAARCHIKQNTLSQIEGATRRVALVELEHLTEALGVPLVSLFDRRRPRPRPAPALVAEEVAEYLHRLANDTALSRELGKAVLAHWARRKPKPPRR